MFASFLNIITGVVLSKNKRYCSKLPSSATCRIVSGISSYTACYLSYWNQRIAQNS